MEIIDDDHVVFDDRTRALWDKLLSKRLKAPKHFAYRAKTPDSVSIIFYPKKETE